MDQRLPPLTALRAFDAAARHLSFAQAAAELHVTPAALSFQIKALEEHLGTPVFHRLNRAVALTEAGKHLAAGVAQGFETLNKSWQSTRRSLDTTTLTITAGPAFTAKWLAPRLFDFAHKHPEIELRFSATLKLADFDRDDVDMAIRFGEGDDDGMFSQTIINEWMTPMMSPALGELYNKPSDLANATLLHQDDFNFITQSSNWDMWFQLSGLPPPPKGGPRFSQADHAHNAAIAGSGVVLGRYSLAESDLRSNTLVAPFDLSIALKAKYRVICPEGSQHQPHVKAFIDWIIVQAEEMHACTRARRFVPQSGLSFRVK